MADRLQVVMLPWSAFGHMMPFFQFSIALAKAGVRVSYVSTPRNIQRLPQIPSNLAPLINLVELPLPKLEDEDLLPEGAEATIDLPFEKVPYLHAAYDLLKEPFKQFVADQSPDYIFADFVPYWTAEIAREYKIPLIAFSVYCCAAKVFFGPPECLVGDGRKKVRSTPESMTSPPEWVNFPSTVAFPGYQAAQALYAYYGRDDNNTNNKSTPVPDAVRVANMFHAIEALAIRSCTEYEGEYLNLMEKLLGKPVIPIGLLPPEKPITREINDEKWLKVFEWLDQQNPKSVLFVGFGSECKLSKDQVHEIAYGLESSKLPFLWSLRKPDWATHDLDALPSSFQQRISGTGTVSFGWAPQSKILAHPSIGGSLFHAGWGSIIETLQYGHTLVVLPFIFDQPLNTRVLVDKGLAVEVERRKEDGSFNRNDIAKALKLAMVSKEGEKIRNQAREVSKVFGNKELHQDHYIGGLVEYLKKGVRKQQK